MECSTNIVNCLRSRGIEPSCISSTIYDNEQKYAPENAIKYNSELNVYYQSNDTLPNQWWQIDFKKRVKLVAYNIVAGPLCYWVTNWKINVSIDGNNFHQVDSYGSNFSKNATLTVPNNEVIRFVKIEGSADICQQHQTIFAFLRVYFYGTICESITCQKAIIKSHHLFSLLTLLLLYNK